MNCSKRMLMLVPLSFLGACAHAPSASQHLSSYAVDTPLALGGSGGWDLLDIDSAHQHLFLSRSDRVDVVDTRNGQLVGSIAGIDGAHGIALAPKLNRGFATAGRSDSVIEFDLATLKREREFKVSGHNPDAILFDTHSGHVFVFNAHSNNASVLDPVSGKELATIAFNGNPELPASDGEGHVFVNIEDKAELVEIDATAMQVLHVWPLSECEEPTGLAMDSTHERLFSVCQNRTMVVTDASDGRQVARVAIDEGPDGVEFDTDRQLVFVPCGKSGTLTIVHEDDRDHFRVSQTLATQTSARTLALDHKTHRVYLPAARFEPRVEGEKGRPPMIEGSFSIVQVREPSKD
ncbi:MAG: YncE family protein [Dokdonella sp.]